jgi:hypothetical protein
MEIPSYIEAGKELTAMFLSHRRNEIQQLFKKYNLCVKFKINLVCIGQIKIKCKM